MTWHAFDSLTDAEREDAEERAAILEYDAKLLRSTAEWQAARAAHARRIRARER